MRYPPSEDEGAGWPGAFAGTFGAPSSAEWREDAAVFVGAFGAYLKEADATPTGAETSGN